MIRGATSDSWMRPLLPTAMKLAGPKVMAGTPFVNAACGCRGVAVGGGAQAVAGIGRTVRHGQEAGARPRPRR